MSFKCDTWPSRTGSGAQSGPVGRGGERAAAAVAVERLRGRRERDGPCSVSLRPWVVAAAAGKGERTPWAYLAEQGGGKGCVIRAFSVFGVGEKDFQTCSSYATS